MSDAVKPQLHGRDHRIGGRDPIPMDLPVAYIRGGDTGSFAAGAAYATDFFTFATNDESTFYEHDYGIGIKKNGWYIFASSAENSSNAGTAASGHPYIRTWLLADTTAVPPEGSSSDAYYSGTAWPLPKRIDAGTSDRFLVHAIGAVQGIDPTGPYTTAVTAFQMSHGEAFNRSWDSCDLFAVRLTGPAAPTYIIAQNADFFISDLFDVS